MRIVGDASAIGAILLSETPSGLAEVSGAILLKAEVCAPPHWLIEIANLVVKAERGERLTAVEAVTAWQRAVVIIGAADVASSTPSTVIFDLARAHRLTAQDAAYLELALRLDLPLLTGDKRLARACASLGVALPFDPRA